MAGTAATGTGAGARGQALVSGVFSDHRAAMVAPEKLKAMGAQLSQADVTGLLIFSRDTDGRVDARAAELPDASEGAGEHGGEVGKGSAPAPNPVFDWQGEWLASDER